MVDKKLKNLVSEEKKQVEREHCQYRSCFDQIGEQFSQSTKRYSFEMVASP
jgi:hypothetical protein